MCRCSWNLCTLGFAVLFLHQCFVIKESSAALAPAPAPEPSKNAIASPPGASTPPVNQSTLAPKAATLPPATLAPKASPPANATTVTTPSSSLPPVADAPRPANSTGKGTSPSHSTTSTGHNGTLDLAQARAAAALGISVGSDPCNTAAQRDLICDNSVPYKHLIFLQLQYCALDQVFSPAAWVNLTTLQSLYFSDCPAKQMPLPEGLLESVTTLQVVASLGRTVENVLAPGLTGVWLSKFYNVRKLIVQDVVVNVSTLSFIVNNLTHLQELSFTNTNLSGRLPTDWPSAGLTSLQVSGNDLEGGIPASIPELVKLTSLDLSSCNLSGSIPSSIGNLSVLQTLNLGSNQLRGSIPSSLQKLAILQYLDLSDNQLNGSVPAFLAHLPALRYLDLSKNSFKGQIPFNNSFIKSLNTFKVGPNALLCYNSSIISAKLVAGLQACDSNGLPPVTIADLSPSPAPALETQGSPPSSHHGPKRIVLIVSVVLASIVVIIVFAVVLSRCCTPKG